MAVVTLLKCLSYKCLWRRPFMSKKRERLSNTLYNFSKLLEEFWRSKFSKSNRTQLFCWKNPSQHSQDAVLPLPRWCFRSGWGWASHGLPRQKRDPGSNQPVVTVFEIGVTMSGLIPEPIPQKSERKGRDLCFSIRPYVVPWSRQLAMVNTGKMVHKETSRVSD